MNMTLKKTPFFLCLFTSIALNIIFAFYNLSPINSNNNSFVTSLIDKETHLFSKNIKSEKKTVDNLNIEIAVLKAEIKKINDKLSSFEKGLNSDMALTDAEIQDMEVSIANDEISNEMNRVNSANKIEDYFFEQAESSSMDLKQEATIKQSIEVSQNEGVSIEDLHCKSSLCRLELKYDLTATLSDDETEEGGSTGFSTTVSSLLDVAVSKEINEAEQTGIAVIYLGQLDDDLAFEEP